MEGVLDDAAGGAGGEAKLRLDSRCERRQVGALVDSKAARRDHFLEVRVVCVGRVRGEGGAGAEEDWDEAAAAPAGRANCVVQALQGRVSRVISRV